MSFPPMGWVNLRSLKRLLLAFARISRAEVRGAMARGSRSEARMAKSGSFGAVPLGFDTDGPRGSAESFNDVLFKFHFIFL